MKLLKFIAYPAVVIAIWVAFAVFTLSALRTVNGTLQAISAPAQPASSPSDATGRDGSVRVAHRGGTDRGPTHSG
jgi:hypothetical protein